MNEQERTWKQARYAELEAAWREFQAVHAYVERYQRERWECEWRAYEEREASAELERMHRWNY